VDFLIVRDNSGGVYQGTWSKRVQDKGLIAEHSFQYTESEVRRLVEVAARAAGCRRGRLHVILKEGGVPAVSALWREVGAAVARKRGVAVVFMNVDFAVYQLIQSPAEFDVIAAPNLIGDILADVAGVLVSSRGVTFSGNFNASGHGVYQTNHGCAQDLAGTDTANPAGQILALAMLLRESFGLDEAAALIEQSLAHVWRRGWRTADLAEPGCSTLGTRAFTEQVVEQILRQSDARTAHEPCVAAG
jgi:3-isopropylmalate dehydrogenase